MVDSRLTAVESRVLRRSVVAEGDVGGGVQQARSRDRSTYLYA